MRTIRSARYIKVNNQIFLTPPVKKTTLYEFENENIRISIEIYFNKENQLIFDGYDRGKSVKDSWGDSDYEYTYTIEPEEVNKFYPIFNLKDGDRAGLLKSIQNSFSVNEAYSLFGKFMNDNNILYNSFTWS